ncbi:GNAT family N-acetyltransferase [Prosthecobacter sp. SYSU 5D2]|uniref:GNAT family N-acetyltransferase n=1 Tax=Prosthecobacter sp. SYSU 5D2 TaxID=3134134 RepID=UPI0031FEE4CA
MRLDIVRDEAGFAALEPVWDALLDCSATCTPFMRWDWVRLWWEEFGADFELTIAVLRNDAALPVAIAPLMIGREKTGMRKHLRHLGFLGGLGEARGERMDFLVPAGNEDEMTPQLCEAFALLREEWETVWLNKLPEESPNHAHVSAALKACAVESGVVIRTSCTIIQLAGGWADFERRLPGRQRRKLQRAGEMLRADHQVIESLVTAEEAASRLDEFAALHRQHFPEGVSTFITPRSWRFHRRLGVKWLASGRALLPYISLDRQMVGGIYGFVERDEFFFYQMGWDAGYSRFSMGHLSLRWALEGCLARGMRIFDMLPGTYRYKSDWAPSVRYVMDLEGYRSESMRASAFRSVRHLKRLLLRSPNPSSIE